MPDWRETEQTAAGFREAFAGSPDARYRPITAWWWSGETLTEERLHWQLDQIAVLGCGGIAVTGFAPHGPVAGSIADDPPGYSDEWFALYRSVLDRCRVLGLGAVSASIYQPGFALDAPRLLTEHPDFRGELLSTRDGVRVEPFGVDFGNRRLVEALAGAGTINRRYLDAVRPYIDDGTMPALFEDEIIAFPRWSPSMAEDFRRTKGYDFPPAAIDTDIGPRTPAYRWDLFDVATRRVEAAYTDVTAAYVEECGLLAGYDQMSRRGTPILASAYYLDPFRTMAWANAPGTDQMGDARFHLSIADLTGAPRVWLEGFHSHGWGMTLEHQARLLFEWGREGANLFLPHGMYYAGRAFWWEWAPPEQGWKQPYARHYPAFAEAVGRLMLALSAGRHRPEVAVLYPLSTIWAGTTGHLEWSDEARQAEAAYLALFGCHAAPSGLEPERAAQPSALAEAGYDRIAVDEVHVDTYDVPIIVPSCWCLRTSTVDALIAGAERGRRVIIVEPVPAWSAEVGRDDPKFTELVARLCELATVVATPAAAVAALPPARAEGLKTQWRVVEDLDVVFITGAGEVRLRGMAGRAPERLDVRSGRVEAHPARVVGDDLAVSVEGPATILALPPGRPLPPPDGGGRWRAIDLPEVWRCEYLPWGENRWGDYRLPANDGTPPVERRTFAFREGDDPAWTGAPLVPEDVEHPMPDRGFEQAMAQVRARPRPAERDLGDGWREVVATYGPKLVVDGGGVREYSERFGIEDLLLTTPLGLKGFVEPWKVDLGLAGGVVRSWARVPVAVATHLVVEGGGVLTVSVDGERLAGPVEGGVLTVPVHLDAGWHEVVIDAEYRGSGGGIGHRGAPRTLLAWCFGGPYERPPTAIWGGPLMHPDYKGSQQTRRFRRRVVVPERAALRMTTSAPGAVTCEVPAVLEPGEHLIEATVGAVIHPAGFVADIELTMGDVVVRVGSDDRWDTAAAGEEWKPAIPVGHMGAVGQAAGDSVVSRRSPLLDVAWLEGPGGLTGHVADAWSDSPTTPPPSWFCFTAAPGARSMTLPLVDGAVVEAWSDGHTVEPVDGRLPLREHARVALRVQAPAGGRGASCFTEHPVLELGDGTIEVGRSWHRQGLDSFSGVVLHRCEVEVAAGDAGPALLDLRRVAGSVAVRVNGDDAGVLLWAPWTVDVELVAGVNVIELEVANTLGPMVARGVPTPFGPEYQRLSGVLDRPRLLVRA